MFPRPLRNVSEHTRHVSKPSFPSARLSINRTKVSTGSQRASRTYSSTHPRDPRVKRSSQSWQTTILVVGIGVSASAAVLLQRPLIKYNVEAPQPAEQEELKMIVAMPPGRHGNLTSEQEAKLKDFWRATLRVFGVPPPGTVKLSDSTTGSVQDNALTPEKKKRRKRSLFGRKRHDEEEEDGDDDDKYGQTKEFHEALANNTPDELRRAFWSMVKHDHPDDLLLRFLRARKWNVDKALVMLISTMQWRFQDVHVDDDIVKNGELAALISSRGSGPEAKEGTDFMTQLRMGKSFLHGTDREGRPMCFVRVRLHKQGEQSEASLERYTVHVIETARLLLTPPVDTAVRLLKTETRSLLTSAVHRV